MGTWGGAGDTESFHEQDGPAGDTHWYNLRDEWLDDPLDPVHWLNSSWRYALSYPGKAFQQIYSNGWSFAYYDPERKQMLSTWYECPQRNHHHLYQTCWCCGQYG